jgi:hypothetical protein
MTKIVAAALVPGVRQDMARAMLPPGALARAENCRIRHGALVRRPPTIDAGVGVAQYIVPAEDFRNAGTPTNAPALSGYLSELGSFGGKQAIITNARAYLRGATGDAWIEGGRCSRALPVKAHWVQYDDSVQTGSGNTMNSGVGQVACATLPGYTAVTYERVDAAAGTKQCVLTVYDLSGIVVIQLTAGEGAGDPGGNGRQNPRIIAAGGKFLWFYQQANGTVPTALIYVRKIDPPLRNVSAENGFTSGTLQGQGYDVCAYDGGNEVIFARYLNSPPQIIISRRSASTSHDTPGFWATLAVQIFTPTGDSLISVYGDDAKSQIWLAYVGISGAVARAVGYDGALAAQVANFNLLAGLDPAQDFPAFAAPSVTSRANGSAWCALTTYRAFGAPATASYQTIVARLDLTGSAPGSYGHILHTHLASRLFAGTTTSFQCWTHTDSGVTPREFFDTNVTSYAWRTQRRYSLSTVVIGLDTLGHPASAVLQPELTPDERASKHGVRGWLPEVAFREGQQDENGNLSTHGFLPALVVVNTNSDTSHDSLGVVLYEWETFFPPTATARRIVEHASGGVVVGGDLQELPLDVSNRTISTLGDDTSVGSNPRGRQNNFPYAPAILAVATADDPTASLIGGAVYQFMAFLEQVDEIGRLHRSAPSNVVAVLVPDATTKVTLTMAAMAVNERELASRAHRAVVHVYATQGNGSVFYRVTPNAGAPAAYSSSYTDLNVTWVFQGAIDSDISSAKVLYTQGGVLPNRPAPAHRFCAVGSGRVMLGGLFEPRLVEISKYERPAEPTQFTREDAFRTMLPERCTGLAFMDGNFVAFTRRGVYLIPGSSLPNDQGAPALASPAKLPSTVGCIDWRSVLEVPDGIMFQGERGIYLLPRGFGQPVLVSEPVQDELQGRRVVSACVVGSPGSEFGPGVGEVTPTDERSMGQHLAVFSVFAPDWIGETDGRLLVFDLERRIWLSIDDPAANDYFGAAVANWGGQLAIASRVQITNDVRVELPGPSSSGAVLETGDVRPAGPTGWTAVKKMQLLVTVLDPRCRVGLELARDGGDFGAPRYIPLTGIGVGHSIVLEWAMPEGREGTAWRFRFSEASDAPSFGVVFHAFEIEHEPTAGLARLAPVRRAA